MLTETQKNEYSSLRVEIIDLTILATIFVNKLNRLCSKLQLITRHELIEILISLRYLENGLILHLVNLDDENSSFSFRSVFKEINKTNIDKVKKNLLSEKLKKYRRNINDLKVKHRNKRIAHLNYTDDLKMDQFLNYNIKIKPLITEVNEIGDLLWGEKIEYKFKVGSLEGIINYREDFNKLEVKI